MSSPIRKGLPKVEIPNVIQDGLQGYTLYQAASPFTKYRSLTKDERALSAEVAAEIRADIAALTESLSRVGQVLGDHKGLVDASFAEFKRHTVEEKVAAALRKFLNEVV